MNEVIYHDGSPGMGERILKYWKDRGVNVSQLDGKSDGCYYGFGGKYGFGAYFKMELAKIITLPEEPKEEPKAKTYPRVMMVWRDAGEKLKAQVEFEAIGKFFIKGTLGKYWAYDHAEDLPEKVTVTLDEIAAWKGVEKEKIEIKP